MGNFQSVEVGEELTVPSSQSKDSVVWGFLLGGADWSVTCAVSGIPGSKVI